MRAIIAQALLCLFLCAGAARAQEDDALATALQRQISLEFVETPLADVLAYIQDKFNVPIVLEEGDGAVTLKLNELPLAGALTTVLNLVDCGYVIDDGVVFVSTLDRIEERREVTRSYAIGDLISPVEDFPASLELGLEQSWGVDGAGAVFGVEVQEAQGADMFDIDMLIEFVIGHSGPNSWNSEGRHIQQVPGMLIVRQTPEVHEQIAAVLDSIRAARGALVAVQARYYALPRDKVADVLGKDAAAGAELRLDAAGRLRLSKSARLLREVNLAGYNTQRICGANGERVAYVRDYDVEVAQSSTAFDPVIGTATAGIQLDVRAILSPDGTSVTLDLKIEVAGFTSPGLAEAAATSSSSIPATPDDGSASKTAAVAGAGSKVQLPAMATDSVKTLLRLPLGEGQAFLRSSRLVGENELAVLVVTPH